jgi:hypothetical protein
MFSTGPMLREFLTLLDGAPIAWLLAVRAQQPMPVIGLPIDSSASQR